MKHLESTFQGADDTILYYQYWLPDTPPKATLIIIHGFGEHSGRYMNIVNYLVPKGYAIYSFDHRGHGRSPGQRGHINHISEFRNDVHAFVQLIRQQTPDLPLFLYGHSMGGLIVLDYGLHHPDGLSGVISSAPAIGELGVHPILLTIGRIMSRILPRFSLNANLDATAISRNEKVVRAYQEDPLVHGRASARLSTELQDAATWIQAHATEWRLPLLILHGTADRLTAPEGSQRFFENVTWPDKQRIVYEGGYHESHNDIHYERVLADLSNWLEAHLQQTQDSHQDSLANT
ncbi:MAG: alpha/beta hydrolase [Chloroflexi bacterium]|nr:MAG: alpha/beta hydrolase [Chloroflexota bacterium]